MERREVSEQLAQMVDAEVRRLLDVAFEEAKRIISSNLEKLHTLANSLLERETLDSDEITAVFEGRELPPLPEDDATEADGHPNVQADSGSATGAKSLQPAAPLESSGRKTTKRETSR